MVALTTIESEPGEAHLGIKCRIVCFFVCLFIGVSDFRDRVGERRRVQLTTNEDISGEMTFRHKCC